LKVAVVIPAYNEARALPGLLCSLGNLRDLFAEVRFVVVDDGSSDGTAEVAARHGAEVVRHPSNRGPGPALLSGLRAAQDADAVVTAGADGAAGREVASRLILAVMGGAGIAVASRYVAGAEVRGVPLLRRLLSRGVSVLACLVLGLPVRDVTSGFRAYSGEVLRGAFSRWGDALVTCRGRGCQLELLCKCLPFAGRVEEVSLAPAGGAGSWSWRDAAEALAWLCRAAMHL